MTGAGRSNGIGYHIAEGLAKRGASVIITYRASSVPSSDSAQQEAVACACRARAVAGHERVWVEEVDLLDPLSIR